MHYKIPLLFLSMTIGIFIYKKAAEDVNARAAVRILKFAKKQIEIRKNATSITTKV